MSRRPLEIPELFDQDDLHFLVGIGGHHAPPNVRLFSYVLPAIELALQNRCGKNSLTLTTSVNAVPGYNYAHEGISKWNQIYWHTREKIACIFAFIQEFFPHAFSDVSSYYGDVQDSIPDESWTHIWDAIAELNPEVCSAFLRGVKRSDSPETKAYAVRHAFWFLDFVFEGDLESTGNIHTPTVSVGSEKEIFFNSIRRGVSALPLDFLEETLDRILLRREQIFQLISPTGNPVPYGEALKGKKGSEKSAEVELFSDQPLSDLGEKLSGDVQYTFSQLKKLSGASREDFLKFLSHLKSFSL